MSARDTFWRDLAASFLVLGSWLCCFFGAVILVYSFRGDRTLTTEQAVACFLLTLPVLVGLMFLRAAWEIAESGLPQGADMSGATSGGQTSAFTRVEARTHG